MRNLVEILPNYGGPKVSRQFQFAHGNFSFTHSNFNLTHGNFNLFTAISICSRQFQYTHGNFNLFTAISACSRTFNLFTAISTCSRQFQLAHCNFNFPMQFQFFNGNAHGIFLRRPTVATKSQNTKLKVDI